MKISLVGYRLHDKKLKDQRTVVAYTGKDEQKFRADIRSGEATGIPHPGKLTPLYSRSK